jgi:1,4-alpha-glucan branching enzyme
VKRRWTKQTENIQAFMPKQNVKGYLALVLHAHLPFVRHPEHEDSLEENWLYEAITETYIPLLRVLEKLAQDRIDFRLTISLTPTLVSMLTDPFLQGRYLRRLARLLELAEKEAARTRAQPEFHALALMYQRRLSEAHATFLDRYRRNLVQGFRELQDAGFLEILASAATHGYLPLLAVNPPAVRAQVAVGIDHYQQVFGRRPRGFWLPECAYYPGVDFLLREYGIRYTLLETHGLTRAEPRPRYGVHAPLCCPSGVNAFGRDPECSRQVWSSMEGYPGDFDYREYYRDIAHDLDFDYIKDYIHRDGIRIDTGFKYCRITGRSDYKEVYVPEWAERKAESHAGNFMFNREKQIAYLASIMDRKPIVVAPYDAELFGHWWYEGPRWLDYLLRKIALEQKVFRLTTLSEYLEEYPASQEATPSMSSWGDKGYNGVWLNGSNDWIYRPLHRSATLLERLVDGQPQPKRLTLRALNQASRELLLAQASDWPFMMSSGRTAEYATQRVKTHLARLDRLAVGIESNAVDESWLSTIENQDNLFPSAIYNQFRSHPGPWSPKRTDKPGITSNPGSQGASRT